MFQSFLNPKNFDNGKLCIIFDTLISSDAGIIGWLKTWQPVSVTDVAKLYLGRHTKFPYNITKQEYYTAIYSLIIWHTANYNFMLQKRLLYGLCFFMHNTFIMQILAA